MRYYEIRFYTHGLRPCPESPKYVTSESAKVGEVAVVLFRRIFGRPANRHVWKAKGFMAGAMDRRGDQVWVEQINNDDRPGFDTKTKTFPLAIIQPTKQLS